MTDQRTPEKRTPRREYNLAIKALQNAGFALARATANYDFCRQRAFAARDALNAQIAQRQKR